MKKKSRLTAEFWERDRKQKRELEAYVAKLKRRVAARKAADAHEPD